jgi:4-hydroxymandelate oxidase
MKCYLGNYFACFLGKNFACSAKQGFELDELVCFSEVSQIHLIATMMTKRQSVSEQIEAVNLLELEMKARELLPQTAYDFYAGGANDEITLRENRLAYERITLLPRMLVDVSERHMATTALGEPVSMPIFVAPTAFQGLAHPEGEVATTKAAGAAKTLMALSTLSTFSIEEVMAVATGPVWFQLYVFKDRAISASLVKRAEVAGCKAIVFTVDVPLLGRRERDVRNQFKLPDDLSVKNLLPEGLREFPDGTAGSGEHFKPRPTQPSSLCSSPARFAFPDTSERRSPGVRH